MASENSCTIKITECETILSHENVTGSPDPICALKELEEMITSFKTRALLLEDEKESLISSLMTFTDDFIFQSKFGKTPLKVGERKEMVDIIDTLTNMVMDVDLKVTTKRSNHEEEALHHVNTLINKLVSKVQEDKQNTKHLCCEFIRSCYTLGECIEEITTEISEGDLEISFQSMITKCTTDDKHRVGRRLHGLLNYIESQL